MVAVAEVQLYRRIWISIVTAIGAFSVSSLSICLGYRLFMVGATGAV
jgi:hypothetical protein